MVPHGRCGEAVTSELSIAAEETGTRHVALCKSYLDLNCAVRSAFGEDSTLM